MVLNPVPDVLGFEPGSAFFLLLTLMHIQNKNVSVQVHENA